MGAPGIGCTPSPDTRYVMYVIVLLSVVNVFNYVCGWLANKAMLRDSRLRLIICAAATAFSLPVAVGTLFVSSVVVGAQI